MTHEHLITLRGAAVRAPGLSARLLRDLVEVLVQGAEQSLRYRIEGRSLARGALPAWLRSASDFRLVELDLQEGHRSFRVQARSLIEAMPEQFGQAELFEDLDPRKSPLDLFEDALEDALNERADSDAFDHALLETCATFRGVLNAGIDSVEIRNGRTMRIDGESVDRVLRLSREPFSPRRVRLAGHLNTIRYSDCRFTLVLDGGAQIAGTAKDLGAEPLRAGFGKNVIVTGMADFRPSGRVLRIDAEVVEPATETDLQIFATVPRPLARAAPMDRPSPKGGLAALLGKWPGEEPAEQLIGQLGQLA